MKTALSALFGLLLLVAPAAQAQFNDTNINGTITITGYTGPGGAVVIPDTLDGLPVTSIGVYVPPTSPAVPALPFPSGAWPGVTSISIPASVTNIEPMEFSACDALTAITVDSNNPAYSSVAGVLFDNNQTTLIQCPGARSGSYTVPNSVGTIGVGAFQSCVNLTNVIISEQVVSIGNGAFAQCYGLTSLTLPENLNTVGMNAFFGCISLTGVVLPDYVTTLGIKAFAGCSNLTDIVIPASVVSIGDFALWDCNHLTAITVAANNPAYSSVAGVLFDNPQTTLIQYPGGLSGSYTIPTGVAQIGANAFLSCDSLTSVTIPATVTNIGDYAFRLCDSLTNVICQGNAPTADATAFDYDDAATVYYHPGTSGWGSTFAGLPAVMLNPPNSAGSLQVTITPGAVTTNGAQWQVDGGVLQPSGATVLGLSAGNHTVSFTAVSGWVTPASQLVSVSANSTTTATGTYAQQLQSQSGFVYTTNHNTITIIGYTGPGGAVVIPDTLVGLPVTSIGGDGPIGVFEGSSTLTSVTIPNSVVSIGNNTFNGCPRLTIVIIPESVTDIGSNVFGRCNALTAITVAASNSDFSSLGGVLFNKRQTTLLQFPEGLFGSYTIPDSVTSIGYAAFSGCAKLAKIIIPNSVTNIGNVAFGDCTNLVGVTIPKNVVSIGGGAFEFCTSLTAITADENNRAYSSVAGVLFDKHQTTLIQCPGGKLGNYVIPNGVTNIGGNAFLQCAGLAGVTIPDSVTSLGFGAFTGCSSLTKVTIPSSVTTIGGEAFSGCTSLTGVYFQGNAPDVDPTAFLSDTKATAYYLAGTSGWGATFAGIPAVMLSGFLQVTITPAAAVSAGAQWRLNGGAYQAGGATVTNLPTINATVSFKPVPGWTTPASQTVTITSGQTNSLVATYLDTSKPTVAFLNLAPGQRVNNSVFTITGTASDNVGVAGVWYQLNNGNWMLAASTNQWTNWFATLPLTPGTNILRAFDQDISSDGFAYVADSDNNVIRKITSAGVVTTFAGGDGTPGFADGTGTNALFNGPNSLTVDGTGNVYVADQLNNVIRKITPAGVVTTLAGDVYDLTNGGYSGNAGYADGPGSAALFSNPQGIAADGSGNLYVADSANSLIRKISPAGLVTTLAGDTYGLTNGGYHGGNSSANTNYGYANGTGARAQFNDPAGLAVDGSGNVFVADKYNNVIRKITPAGVVTTLAGCTNGLVEGGGYVINTNSGYADGPGAKALFNNPSGVAVDGSGNVYVADSDNNLIRKITSNGVVTTLAGDTYGLINANMWGDYSNSGYGDGVGASAQFNNPYGVATDGFGNVLVADLANNLIREISADAVVTTLAGDTQDLTNNSGNDNWGDADGTGTAAQFRYPTGVAAGGSFGNASLITTVTFDYVVTNLLQVQVVGPGTISPNDSNAWLEVGRNYSLTATPEKGCVFASWTMATNWLGGVTTNQATVQFMMASNLTLTATFVDTQKPTLTITSPKPNQIISNSVIFAPGTNGPQPQIIVMGTDLCSVAGTAADNVGVTGVWYQVNTNGWQNATGTTNWLGLVTLQPGGNRIQAYAMDAAGNTSLTSSVPVVFWNMTQLTVQTNQPGWGVIRPNWNNAWLVINSNYTLTATAAAGFRFTNWTSNLGLVSTSAALKFTMQSNLVLTANFVETTRPMVAARAGVVPLPAPSVCLAGVHITAGGLSFNLQITGAASGSIQVSTNLTSWATLTHFAGTNATISFRDPAATNSSCRFYRAVGGGD